MIVSLSYVHAPLTINLTLLSGSAIFSRVKNISIKCSKKFQSINQNKFIYTFRHNKALVTSDTLRFFKINLY